MTKRELAYFKAAQAVSEISDHPRYKIGAIIVYKHRIISSGCNSFTKCHPIQVRLDTQRYGVECAGKCHAETSALLPLIREGMDLSRASIYVVRYHKNGNPAIARPCLSCEKLIKQCGIRKIFYTIDNGFAQEKW